MLSRAGRLVGRRFVAVLLWFFYVLGVVAAAVVVTALTIGGAVRLGWSDVRKRAHGAA